MMMIIIIIISLSIFLPTYINLALIINLLTNKLNYRLII